MLISHVKHLPGERHFQLSYEKTCGITKSLDFINCTLSSSSLGSKENLVKSGLKSTPTVFLASDNVHNASIYFILSCLLKD